jgi:uncharacterized membrane protein YgdD (TMEM256/DUF423 family)
MAERLKNCWLLSGTPLTRFAGAPPEGEHLRPIDLSRELRHQASMRAWLTFAAVLGFLCVALGAFAAHGLTNPQAQAWMRTGAEYGFAHVLASLACVSLIRAGASRARFAPRLFLPGVVIFSGTLAGLALGGPRWLGAITPVGGVLFLAGWGALAWAVRDLDL